MSGFDASSPSSGGGATPAVTQTSAPTGTTPAIKFEDLTMNEMGIICNIPGNDKCMDCGFVRPEWASLGFGILICLDCAGFHRSLGAHLSLVRSMKMDSWSALQKAKLMRGGNRKFADYLTTKGISTSTEPAIMHKKYTNPELLYYREIIQAIVEERPAAPYEASFWITVATPLRSTRASNGSESQSPKWFPDEEAAECMLCGVPFTLLNRRHHCRRCGKCVCKVCAPRDNSRPILEWGMGQPVRHCKECYMSPMLSWG